MLMQIRGLCPTRFITFRHVLRRNVTQQEEGLFALLFRVNKARWAIAVGLHDGSAKAMVNAVRLTRFDRQLSDTATGDAIDPFVNIAYFWFYRGRRPILFSCVAHLLLRKKKRGKKRK